MYDLRIPIVGTALTAPERRVVEKTGTPVTTFRVVMNYRRYDKLSEQWVDSGLFRVRVNCWRGLADHVFQSIRVGDPVMVVGRIFTRDWRAETGEVRVMYEIDADAVGHDLSRGVTTFTKTRIDAPYAAVEDAEAESRIGGELSFRVGEAHDPYDVSGIAEETADDALAMLRQAGMAGAPDEPDEPASGDDEDEDDLVGAAASGRRRRGR